MFGGFPKVSPPVFTKVEPRFHSMTWGRLVERVAPDDDARHFLDDQIGHQKDPGDLWAKAKHWKILKSMDMNGIYIYDYIYTNNKYIHIHVYIYIKQERDIKIWYIIINICAVTFVDKQSRAHFSDFFTKTRDDFDSGAPGWDGRAPRQLRSNSSLPLVVVLRTYTPWMGPLNMFKISHPNLSSSIKKSSASPHLLGSMLDLYWFMGCSWVG